MGCCGVRSTVGLLVLPWAAGGTTTSLASCGSQRRLLPSGLGRQRCRGSLTARMMVYDRRLAVAVPSRFGGSGRAGVTTVWQYWPKTVRHDRVSGDVGRV